MMAGLVKAGALAAPVLVSALVLLLVLGPAALVVGLVALVLLAGVGERAASSLLLRARDLSPMEREVLAPALVELASRGAGEPVIGLRVARMHTYAIGFGRHTVVVADDLVEEVLRSRVPVNEATAVIAHAAGTVRAGMCRCDAGVALWCLPWRLLARLFSPLGRGLLGFAWKMRPVVFTVAIVQSWEQRPWVSAIIAGMLALTYLTPVATRAWVRRLEDAGDAAVVAWGLCGALADLMRRLAPDRRLLERIHRLEADQPKRHLRLVS